MSIFASSAVSASPDCTAPFTTFVAQGEHFLDDLTRLRTDALIMLGWITGGISYLCLIFLIWPVTGTGAVSASWLGALSLLAMSALAILGSRHFQRTARYGFAIGVHIAAACGMITLAEPAGAYLFLLPYVGPERQPLEESFEFIHLGFWLEDLVAVYQRLVALEARIVREDVKERREFAGDAPPVSSFKVLDPDSNVLDISERKDEWRT